jgi:hypothetical protein
VLPVVAFTRFMPKGEQAIEKLGFTKKASFYCLLSVENKRSGF